MQIKVKDLASQLVFDLNDNPMLPKFSIRNGLIHIYKGQYGLFKITVNEITEDASWVFYCDTPIINDSIVLPNEIQLYAGVTDARNRRRDLYIPDCGDGYILLDTELSRMENTRGN